jgi:oxygen-independent coproporphyrinogen-3 oxidase
LKYWRREPYLGFGADAHSFDGEMRWQNVESAAEYVQCWREGRPVVAERTVADAAGEPFFLGLRLSEGIPAASVRSRPGVERFLKEGLLEESSGRLRLTARGVLLSNEVFAEFI